MKYLLVLLGMIMIFNLQAQITLIKEDETCKDRKDGRIEVQVQGVSSTLQYEWSYDGNPYPGGKIISGLAPGVYQVTVSTKGGCMGTKAAQVRAGREVNVDISAVLTNVSPSPVPCATRPTFTYQLTAVPSGGNSPYYCSWGSGGLGTNEGGGGEGECSKSVSGQFINQTVTIIDDKGCIDSDGFKKIAAIKVCARDPNDITGPDGYDTLKWVSVRNEMDYAIRFENDPIFATSNAAVIFVTVPIDDDINPFSFRLGTIGFGSKIIQVPDNVSFYQQRLDYSQDLGFMLDVTAGLDIPNNRVFWLMETIDPTTGQPPTNPTAGFLPVNDTLTGSGEGFVNFTCKPKAESLTGETVSHQASIIFDANDPLLTNTWVNTIDAFAPSTIASDILDTLFSNEVPFEWSIADDPGGCGVQYTQVMLSTNNLGFQSNGLMVDSNTLSLPLNWGTKYYYRITGTDFVENRETVEADSFYIIPRRSIAFVTPDQNEYCLNDTLPVNVELISLTDVDLYISIDSGLTYSILDTNISNWPYPFVLDSAVMFPNTFIKARNESSSIESISIPFSVNPLPELEALADPGAGCVDEILVVQASGANSFSWHPDTLFGSPFEGYSNVYSDSSQWVYVKGTDVFLCSAYDSIFLTIYPGSKDTLTQPLCAGDSIWLNGQWISEEGLYPYTYADVHGCDSVLVTEVFFESPCIWAGGQNVYVDKDATGDNNGTSWADAFNELRDAVYVAGRYENVQEIWVAEGVYHPHTTNRDTSFILRDSIKIYGGFLGFETSLAERTADPELVQLSGDINVQDTLWDNSYHTVIFSQTCLECIVDGVTITYGHADHANNPDNIGAGVLNEGVGHFKNVIFERNYATDQGGALHSSGAGASLIIEDCIFRLNTSSLGKDVVNLAGAQIEFRGANGIH